MSIFPPFVSDNMKTILEIAVLAVLVFGGSSRCLADQVYHPVTRQMAQEFGANIRWRAYNTNDIEVMLEFSAEGKLARFSGCDLVVAAEHREVVRAALAPAQQTNDQVVFSFMVSRDFLEKSSLILYVPGPVYDAGYTFALKDFVKLPPTFTFVGVPRGFSTNTFREYGLQRGMTVDVARVTAGNFGEKQVELAVPAEWPLLRLPKVGNQYSITAGYKQQDGHLKILEYHEIK
jgi:hypothetical protein